MGDVSTRVVRAFDELRDLHLCRAAAGMWSDLAILRVNLWENEGVQKTTRDSMREIWQRVGYADATVNRDNPRVASDATIRGLIARDSGALAVQHDLQLSDDEMSARIRDVLMEALDDKDGELLGEFIREAKRNSNEG